MKDRNCFMAGSEVNFKPGSKLTLYDDYYKEYDLLTTPKLTIDGSVLDVCGNQKWKGIRTGDPSDIIINNSSINNADVALECRGSRSLDVKNTEFRNNYISIDMESLPSETFAVDPFNNNKFINDSGYLPTYEFTSDAPLVGMRANRVPLVMVNNSEFSNMSNGVVLLESNSILGNSTFTNIKTPNDNNIINNTIEGNAIYISGQGNAGIFLKNEFNENYRAIGVRQAHSITFDNVVRGGHIGFDVFAAQNRTTRIFDNDIEIDDAAMVMTFNSPTEEATITNNTIHTTKDGGFGILVNEFLKNNDYDILNNPMIKIHDDARGISIRGGGTNLVQGNYINAESDKKDISGTIGIEILGSDDNIFCDNTIQFPPSKNEQDQTKGIFLSAGSDNYLSCNYTFGATYGINTWGFTDSQIRNNTFTGNYTGLYYGLYPSEGNVNTGQQDYMKNVWRNGTFVNGLFGAEHLNNDQFIVDLSRYLVDDTDQPFTSDYDTPENAVTNWIFNLPSSGILNFTCDNDACSSTSLSFTLGGQSSGNPTFAFSVANGTPNLSSNYNVEQNWIADYHLYNILEKKEGRGEFVHPGLGNFTNSVSNEILSLGQVNSIASEALTESASILNASNNMLQEVQYISDNYENVSKQDYNIKLNLIDGYNTQLQALLVDDNTDRNSDVQSIINSLPARNNTTSGYYADAYEQALNMIGSNAVDLQKLNVLASMCPIEAGEAVYLARQILKALGENIVYDDIAACDRPDSAPRSSLSLKIKKEVNIYPNPSSGIIHIETKEKILNVLVSGVTNEFTPVKLRDDFIDISDYLPGVYLLKIETESGEIVFEKVLLVK
jgi:hypothetical protein